MTTEVTHDQISIFIELNALARITRPDHLTKDEQSDKILEAIKASLTEERQVVLDFYGIDVVAKQIPYLMFFKLYQSFGVNYVNTYIKCVNFNPPIVPMQPGIAKDVQWARSLAQHHAEKIIKVKGTHQNIEGVVYEIQNDLDSMRVDNDEEETYK